MGKKENKRINACVAINSVLIALMPWCYMFEIPSLEINLSSLFLLVCSILTIVYFFNAKVYLNSIVLFIVVFCLYFLMRSIESSYFFLYLCLLIVLVGAFYKSVDFNYFFKTMLIFAILNSVAIVVQTFIFYSFGTVVELVPTQLLSSSVGVPVYSGGLYRPHAFFLEPSHFAEYCSIVLILLLAYYRKHKMPIILIVLGVLFSTSGIGIVLMVAIFIFFALFGSKKATKNIRKTFVVLISVVLIFVALMQIPFFKAAIERFILNDNSSYNAITGRIGYFNTIWQLLQTNSSKSFGLGANAIFDFYLNGFTLTLLHFGVVGLCVFSLLFYLLSFQSFRFLLNVFRWYSLGYYLFRAALMLIFYRYSLSRFYLINKEQHNCI